MFKLYAPEPVETTNFHIKDEILSNGFNGMFRASLEEIKIHMPKIFEIVRTIPLSVKEANKYEYDVKVHMLMPNQYPCIPNWHCDNVPRDENKLLDYSKCEIKNPPMFLWISGCPQTEFLRSNINLDFIPENHDVLSRFINNLLLKNINDDKIITQLIKPNCWYKINNLTPHRGTISTTYQWRIFIRATHKNILPTRPKISPIRRHSQVYLDAKSFSW